VGERAEDKAKAQAFLRRFQRTLENLLPLPGEMESCIQRTTAEAKDNYAQRHLRKPEAAFLNGSVVPALSKLVCQVLPSDRARKALLNEFHPCMSSVSCGSPASTQKHPFTKMLSVKPETIYERWSADPFKALVQSWPDFALRKPFPHKIVFEGKYFSGGSLANARRVLVSDIYQAFFYRGLPFVEETKKGRAAWDYDYACLVAYDASRDGTLKQAWEGLPRVVQGSFWSGANIYVMILGGQGRSTK